MIGFNYGAVALAVLSAIGLMACAPPEVDEFEGMHDKKTRKQAAGQTDKGDGDEAATDPDGKTETAAPSDPPAGNASNTPPGSPKAGAAEPPHIQVTFALAAKHTYAGATVFRVCSDRGAHHQNATLIDGTSLRLVSVDTPTKVLATVDGTAFQNLKAQMLDPASGVLDIPVNAADLTATPQEFAMIVGGDDRFRGPADCQKTSLRAGSAAQRDVEEFPNSNIMAFNTKIGGSGCGIVGFVEAHFDRAQQKVIAQPSSQLLLAADDEGRAGFPKGNYYPACDGHDSPLVIDLSGEHGGGVTLSAQPLPNVFDVDGDGRLDDSNWVSSEETPFLVHDANGNGVVDGIDEMFGNRTHTRGKPLFHPQNGFEALSVWDDATDGVIDAKDKIWSSLRLWFDRNHDGRTDPGEIETLESRGVRSIALSFVSVKEGAVRQRGGVTMTDGRIVSIVDVWFQRRL